MKQPLDYDAMKAASSSRPVRDSTSSGMTLGERVRELRVAAGQTQTDLAGDRFSKEYVSQIERGKTRPTRDTVVWLAARLGVDPEFLANGVSADERERYETRLARADALAEAERFQEAAELFAETRAAVAARAQPELEVRAICGEWKALVPLGRVREAL